MKINSGLVISKSTILFLLLFLASMNFMAKFFYFVFLAIVVVLIFDKKIIVDKLTYVYLLLCFCMASYNIFTEGVLSSVRCLSGLVFYMVGRNILDYQYEYDDRPRLENRHVEKQMYMILTALAGGSFIHYMANFFLNFGNNIGRNTVDIWSQVSMAATGQAALACIMSGFSIALIVAPPKKIFRYVGVILLVSVFMYNLTLAGRTLLVMISIVLLFAVIYRYKNIINPTRRHKFLTGAVFIVLSLCALYIFNVGGIRDAIEESALFERLMDMSGSRVKKEDSRVYRKFMHLTNFHKHPFGGSYKRTQFGYAHDLLLDGYDEYGILVLALLTMVVFIGIKEAYKFCRYSLCSTECKVAFACVYISILIEFTVEPILAGMQWLFCCFCLINGYIKSVNHNTAIMAVRRKE